MADETPYLICHKVRGQPAFDIAIRVQIGNEEGWIIPTSGHRAYPFWQAELSIAIKNYLGEGHPKDMKWLMTQLSPTLPDHYSMNDTKPKRSTSELTLEDLEI